MFRQLATRGLRVQNSSFRQGLVARSLISTKLPTSFSPSSAFHSSVPSKREEEPLPPSIFEKYQLYETSRWVPLVLGSFGALTATGLYHFDSESQMLGLFVLYVGVIYSQGGDAIGKYFDDTADAILKEQRAVEDTQIKALRSALEIHKAKSGIYEDIKEIIDGQKAMIAELGKATEAKLKHELRDTVQRRLDIAVAFENTIQTDMQKKLVRDATASVEAAFSSGDNQLRADALSSAIATIQDPSSKSSDPVEGLYKQFFANHKQKIQDSVGKEVELDDESHAKLVDMLNTIARRENLEATPVEKKFVRTEA